MPEDITVANDQMWKFSYDQINLYYTSEAWLKTWRLINYTNLEIAWNMVVKPYKDGYKIYDVLVYPQKVYKAKIEIDDGKYGLWKDNLTVEQDANLFGQAHSHVDMLTLPSPRDLANQSDEVAMKKYGFLLFQIYNKRGDIWSRIYDIDNKLIHQNINHIVEVGKKTLSQFLNEVDERVTEAKKEFIK